MKFCWRILVGYFFSRVLEFNTAVTYEDYKTTFALGTQWQNSGRRRRHGYTSRPVASTRGGVVWWCGQEPPVLKEGRAWEIHLTLNRSILIYTYLIYLGHAKLDMHCCIIDINHALWGFYDVSLCYAFQPESSSLSTYHAAAWWPGSLDEARL